MSVECWNFVFFMVHYSDFIYSFICEIPCLSDSLCRWNFILFLKKKKTKKFFVLFFKNGVLSTSLFILSWKYFSCFSVLNFSRRNLWLWIKQKKNISTSKHKSNNNKFNETNLCNSWIHNLSMMKPEKDEEKYKRKKKSTIKTRTKKHELLSKWHLEKKRRHTNEYSIQLSNEWGKFMCITGGKCMNQYEYYRKIVLTCRMYKPITIWLRFK